jgi:hypothetical protein
MPAAVAASRLLRPQDPDGRGGQPERRGSRLGQHRRRRRGQCPGGDSGGPDRAVLHLLARPRRARRACRKPQPGLVPQAADALGLDPADMVVIADRLSDFQVER